MDEITPIDSYRYEARGTLEGRPFSHAGVVYAEYGWEAAELAEEEVRTEFPGVVLSGDDPSRGVTCSPKVFVTRDIVNRIINAEPVLHRLVPFNTTTTNE